MSAERLKTALALTCSFCGKSEHEVHIINGPAVAICEECVLLCVGILLERPNCKTVSDAIIHAAVNITPEEHKA